MTGITEILMRIADIADRINSYEELPTPVMAIFAVVLIFGIMNCVLGYRLLRFWVMLFGFAVGAMTGLFVAQSMGLTDKVVCLGIMAATGAIVGLISFMVYKIGIFVLGAGLGMTISIYILHPTTSFIFFLCLLIGVAVGGLGVKFAKEVIIAGTSLLGGMIAGYSLARLGKLSEIPFGIAMGAVFVIIGLMIQFATNRGDEEEDGEDEEPEETGRTDTREKTAAKDRTAIKNQSGENDGDIEEEYIRRD